jgi:predicted cupin superfamily sugar epimerase
VSSVSNDIPAAELVRKLGLQPHPEGGWYREIYRSPTRVETARGVRSALTTIYYLLEQGQLSRWHVVQADELWHFYAGVPLELLEYDSVGRRFARHVLGPVGGATAVAVIPTGVWQAARSLGAYSLVGCTVGPGFEFADFQFVADLPAHADHLKGDLVAFANLL